jgi:hypothetical protein
MKQHLGGRRHHNNEEVGMQEPGLYRDVVFKLLARWDRSTNVLEMLEDNDNSG